MNKRLMSTVIVAATLSGAAAGALLFVPGQALAESATVVDSTETSDDAVDKPSRDEHVREALQGLVDDGTLTEAQVDAVVEALAEARPEGRHGPRGDRGGHPRGAHSATVAEALGITVEELKAARSDGKTIAEIAVEQGVDTQDVIDAIVAATTERVEAAVTAGRIDQERADEIIAGATERATAFVNGERPDHEDGLRGAHGRRGARR